jgi:hypothetical protein
VAHNRIDNHREPMPSEAPEGRLTSRIGEGTLRNRKLHVWKVMPVLVAAYLFVMQTVLGTVALGASIADPQIDMFGNPLCITRMDDSGSSDHKDGSQLPKCCTQACSMFAPVLALQTSGSFIINSLEAKLEPLDIPREVGPLARPETSPGNPRAPPLSA